MGRRIGQALQQQAIAILRGFCLGSGALARFPNPEPSGTEVRAPEDVPAIDLLGDRCLTCKIGQMISSHSWAKKADDIPSLPYNRQRSCAHMPENKSRVKATTQAVQSRPVAD
jgi:hypothetical protein